MSWIQHNNLERTIKKLKWKIKTVQINVKSCGWLWFSGPENEYLYISSAKIGITVEYRASLML